MMNKEKSQKRIVLQGNEITNARVTLTKTELNCFLFILSKLKEDVYEYNISTSDMLKFLNVSNKNISYVRKSLDKLLTTAFLIPEENDFLRVTILQHYKYQKNISAKGSYINFMVAEKIRPYLFNLQDNYTILNLAESLSLSKKNSYILYTLLRKWKSTKKAEVEMQELRRLFGIKKSTTGVFLKVIEDCVKDITKHTSIRDLKFEKIKNGRTITHIKFAFKLLTKAQMDKLVLKDKMVKIYDEFTDLERNMFNRLNAEFGISEENSLWTIQTCVKHNLMNKLKSYLQRAYVKNKSGEIDFITTYVQNGIKKEILGISK
jgi:plasmid replication initiation protein